MPMPALVSNQRTTPCATGRPFAPGDCGLFLPLLDTIPAFTINKWQRPGYLNVWCLFVVSRQCFRLRDGPGRIDKPDVAERLREVPQQFISLRIYLLGE